MGVSLARRPLIGSRSYQFRYTDTYITAVCYVHDSALAVSLEGYIFYIGSVFTDMPTSPVKTRIPLTSFGHLITEVKRQLFGIEAPTAVQLTGWRKHFNSYTLQGRRNCVLVTYGLFALSAAIYMLRRGSKEDNRETHTTA
ncbi:hypothetical protein MATL_G00008990 [Megalops atlanticus]|uniref:Uncharacterized protein n=1 Tax=Megalops atlanticus TaxID=7932 RepID=A0A9D3QJ84_MEGAT|nr:hypothetical protein MATL_G00008990 [Megalops atlanticus]